MPNALAIGVSYDQFWHLNPKKLQSFIEAQKIKDKHNDYLAWLSGQYTLSAVSVAIEHCFAGKKAKSKYIEKPLLETVESENKELTEEEIKRKREEFKLNMQIMRANFELKKKKRVENEQHG